MLKKYAVRSQAYRALFGTTWTSKAQHTATGENCLELAGQGYSLAVS